ncbi:MAG: hypothetical protein WA081_12565 [Desulfosalsimonadaceae bacterium]
MPVLEDISRLYSLDTSIHLVTFENKKLANLSHAISKLFSSLGEQHNLDFWPGITSSLKKYRYEISILPLPFSSPEILSEDLLKQLTHAIRTCQATFPEQLEQLKDIFNLFKELPDQEHPFMEWIKNKFKAVNENNTVINMCLPAAKYIPVVERFINRHYGFFGLNFNLINPRQLKEFKFYDQVIFCGSTALYSRNQYSNREYIWRSPRSNHLFFLSFSWIADSFIPKPDFDIQPNKITFDIHKEKIIESNRGDSFHNEDIDIPAIKFEDINISPIDLIPDAAGSAHHHTYDYHCSCKPVFMEDGSFLYKEMESTSRIVAFLPEIKILKIKNEDLEPGKLLIVRTEGSGDSIAAVADMLLGKETEMRRRQQDEWKTAFRKKLYSYPSLFEAAIDLINTGSTKANETNIRNWRSQDTIKPNSYTDFQAILIFSGISENIEEYWANAQKISRTHIMAGHRISKLLLQEINNSSRITLEKYGRLDIELKGVEGKLSIIRIEAVPEYTLTVSASQVNKLFKY